MNEKEQAKFQREKIPPSNWWKKVRLIILLLIIFFGGLWLIQKFTSPEKKSFSLEKKGEEIVIYDLERKDIEEKIDWTVIKWAPAAGKKNQYHLPHKKLNFFQKIVRRPVIYNTFSSVPAEELRDKTIKFPGFSGLKEVKIEKTEPEINKINSQFITEEGLSVKNLFFSLLQIVGLAATIWLSVFIVTGVNLFSLLFSRSGRTEANIPSISFRSVGGLHEAKEELGEIVAYFRNPQVFWQRGAKVPKGILLVGPPGNGKTLLAKAVAGECGLPFLFRSGSEFEEVMVGLGARRVRELFRKARNYPQGCIIFIDEIDSIGKKRHTHHSNDLTLNQLLNELDGFRPRENIVILAATNSLNVLDSALLRPGRFDRHIYIPPPNLKGRREIISLHARHLALAPNLDLEEIAAMTRGFSGAQITNMFNEASILSIRHNQKTIDQEIIFEAYDRVLMGPSLTSHTITPAKKKLVAYHEAGHALVGLSLLETTVKKITIVPRWTAGGYTWTDLRGEEGDDYMLNKNQMLARIMTALGGRASEELIFGSEYITMGAYSDFKTASEIVRDLILTYGMSDLGIIPTQESFFYGQEIPAELPETAKQKIENEREKILSQCWEKVRNILRQNRKILDLLATELLRKDSLQKEEIYYIFITQTSPSVLFLPK